MSAVYVNVQATCILMASNVKQVCVLFSFAIKQDLSLSIEISIIGYMHFGSFLGHSFAVNK